MRLKISIKGFNDIIDIIPQILKIVKSSSIKEEICLVSCPGSAAGIITPK